MWAQLNRIIKPNGATLLFGSEPFSSALRMSNIKNYKYDWEHSKVISTEEKKVTSAKDVLVFDTVHPQSKEKVKHGTQKPVDLME